MDKQKPQSGPATAPDVSGKPAAPPRTGPAPQVGPADGSSGSKDKSKK